MKNNDFDFIKNKIDEANINAPDELNEEFVMNKLDDNGKIIKLGNSNGLKRAFSLVACVAIFAIVAVAGYNMQQNVKVEKVPAVVDEVAELNTFSSEDELSAMLKKMTKRNNEFHLFDYEMKSDSIAENVDDADNAYAVNGSTADMSVFGETYKQVAGVDEADIIKTNGKYIFFCSPYGYCVNVYDVNGKKSKQIAQIDIPDEHDYVSEMFLYGDKLVVLTSTYMGDTEASIYDITDVENVKLLKTFSQSGSYNSSRMIGGMLYLVSTKYSYSYRDIPYCNDGDSRYKCPIEDIYYVPDNNEPVFLVVSAVDVDNLDSKTKTKSILGATGEVYCNEDNMYVSYERYDEKKNEGYTKIVKIKLGKSIKFVAGGKVRGRVINQYAFDEKDGLLRVAATITNSRGEDINTLYVLDENLNKVSNVDSFAKTESIKAVKYIGDYAYVITYEETDPLFVIDLSDPNKPEILGECKINGFSTMLIPVGDDRLLGIGYHTDEGNEYSGGLEIQNGVKLALFDISDKTNPRVLDEKIFRGTSSPVQDNAKALVYNSFRDSFVIPMNKYDNYNDVAGALIFSVEGEDIAIENEYYSNPKYNSFENAQRCTFVDDTVYILMDSEIDSVDYK